MGGDASPTSARHAGEAPRVGPARGLPFVRMGIFVKLCGLCTARDVEVAAEVHPDAVGFVFWPKSVRAVWPADVAVWTQDFPTDIERVGVFVTPTRDELLRAIELAGLTVVQLHGVPSREFCRQIPCRVWVSAPRTPDGGWTRLETDHPAEVVVLDSGSDTMPGGTGRVSDWSRAAKWVQQSPHKVLLAGGLTPENVQEAIRRVRPWGVDTSSGIESAPGRKDPTRMREFVQRCREL